MVGLNQDFHNVATLFNQVGQTNVRTAYQILLAIYIHVCNSWCTFIPRNDNLRSAQFFHFLTRHYYLCRTRTVWVVSNVD